MRRYLCGRPNEGGVPTRLLANNPQRRRAAPWLQVEPDGEPIAEGAIFLRNAWLLHRPLWRLTLMTHYLATRPEVAFHLTIEEPITILRTRGRALQTEN
jgi:hypothetical protein